MGVTAKATSVQLTNILNGPEAGPEGFRTHPQQHHPVAQGHSFSKKLWLITRSPQTMPLLQCSLNKTHHDIPITMTQLTSWSNTTSTQSTIFTHRHPECTCHSTWVVDHINQLGRLQPSWWRGCGKGQRSQPVGGGGPAYHQSCDINRTSWQLQTAMPNSRQLNLHQWVYAHWQLGTSTSRLNGILFRFAITGLLFSCVMLPGSSWLQLACKNGFFEPRPFH